MTTPTWLVNHLYSSSVESSMSPSLWEPSLHCVIRVVNSSPSNNPGTCRENHGSSSWQHNIQSHHHDNDCTHAHVCVCVYPPLHWLVKCSFSQGTQSLRCWTRPGWRQSSHPCSLNDAVLHEDHHQSQQLCTCDEPVTQYTVVTTPIHTLFTRYTSTHGTIYKIKSI